MTQIEWQEAFEGFWEGGKSHLVLTHAKNGRVITLDKNRTSKGRGYRAVWFRPREQPNGCPWRLYSRVTPDGSPYVSLGHGDLGVSISAYHVRVE